MHTLPVNDFLALNAAEGWIILGNVDEAFLELQRVSAQSLEHPAALAVVWKAFAAAERWEEALLVSQKLAATNPESPLGPLCLAQSLAHQERLAEAREALLAAEQRFGGHQLVAYNLACYYCRLGWIYEAREWLVKAVARGGRSLLYAALEDPDLEPIHPALRNLLESEQSAANPPLTCLSRFEWHSER